MSQLELILLVLKRSLNPVFALVHGLLSHPAFPTTCIHPSLTRHANIKACLFGLSLACATHSLVTIARTLFTKRVNFITSFILAMIIICTCANLVFSWLDETASLCIDFNGVEMSPYMYIEWLITVPSMFLLVTWYSFNVSMTQNVSLAISLCGALSVFCLFLGNVEMSNAAHQFFFFVANVLMTLALAWQITSTVDMNRIARNDLSKIPLSKRNSELYQDILSRVALTETKIYLAILMLILYCLFPGLYYLRMYRILDYELCFILMYCASYFVKFVLSLMMIEKMNAVLDDTDLAVLDEKKRQAASKQMLLRYVFHEIRVPLNSLTLGLQYLKSQEPVKVSNPMKDVVNMMQESTSFMSETLNDVLSFQKIDDGAMGLEKTWFDPRNLIAAVATTFKYQLRVKRMTMEKIIDQRLPVLIYGDQFRLEHVLSNFVSNSIKFSPEGSNVIVSISYKTRGLNLVTFAVRDQGVGVSKDDQSRLFKVFSQIKPDELQNGEGSGLGLSICKSLIAMHSGEIGCNSPPHNAVVGSEFHFSIGHDEVALTEFQAALNMLNESESRKNEITTGDLSTMNDSDVSAKVYSDSMKTLSMKSCVAAVKTKNILLVDDNVSNCKILKLLLLERSVQTCDICSNGLEALKAVLHSEASHPLSHYDLIFMDSNMPKMTGVEAASKLREAGFKNMIVGLSGNALQEDVEIFEASGADAVISKPMNAGVLDLLLMYCEKYGVISPVFVHGVKGRKKFKSFLFVH